MAAEETADGWWQGFFDATYADIGLRRDDVQAVEAVVDFILKTLDVESGQRVLDQCCGVGRISIPLARRGVQVHGVDQSKVYIERAQAEADAESLACTFVHGNALEHRPDAPCDAAFNWFTSCGYLDDDTENSRMFEAAFDSLKPGGYYVVDYIHTLRVLTEFKETLAERCASPDGEILLVVENVINPVRGMYESLWTFVHSDGRRETRPVQNRTWVPTELLRLLRGVGFDELRAYGSTAGEPLALHSQRCIIVGRKPR